MAKKTRQDLLLERILSITGVGYGISGDLANPDVAGDARSLTKFNQMGMSLLYDLYGPDHFHTKEFLDTVGHWGLESLQKRIGVLEAVAFAVQGGWYESTRALIAAELFDDFLDMAAHLLDEGYKEAAAVIAGTSLETHLRRLAVPWNVDLKTPKGDHKKAEIINQELCRAGAYVLNEQKQVTAWLGIRNDAAHGNYDKVIDGAVRIMIDGIKHFINIHPA